MRDADEQALTLAVSENVIRTDLNPLVEARADRRLVDKHGDAAMCSSSSATASAARSSQSTISGRARSSRPACCTACASIFASEQGGPVRARPRPACTARFHRLRERALAAAVAQQLAQALERGTMVRTIFGQPDAEIVREQHRPDR